ncbi:hypothetical protein G3I59_24805 [Amycolatopsis rubida]|uniref:Uncharacterized protein n=1 Tax=Amycolatopsis rubida TaxID=112413 RepID=A0ABX0BUY5_9PSEU|nr:MULTISPECIES: hypothetical protein [Amycolatopsis]MYW93746.1 hypothetical protein [Amycolatopsis rubida]NEC58733.1 hypothetical protein [Amycolatopsis rubida]OAP22928.1 hypothetical protein A4R44_06390 [Amycolatopsis sp. M39]
MGWTILVLGGAAALAAGLCAYVVLLAELARHFPDDRRPARREAGRQAMVAAGFFLMLGAVLAVVLPRVLARAP